MKSLHKILKISAKEAFKDLQKKSPIFRAGLRSDIFITRTFWHHINFAKDRELQEIIKRLSFFPLIRKILTRGNLAEKRDNFIKMTLTMENIGFSLIIVKNSYRYTLLSCFIEKHKKHLVSP